MTRKEPSLGERLSGALTTLRHAPRQVASVFDLIVLAWRAHPIGFGGVLSLELAQGLTPLATAWLTKALFDMLARGVIAAHGPPPPGTLLLLLAAQAALIVATQLITPASAYLNAELARRTTLSVQEKIYRKLANLTGLAPLEEPQFHDTIRIAALGAQHSPLQSLRALLLLGRSAITLVAFLGLLLSFSPLLAGVVGLAVLPQLCVQLRLGRQRFGLLLGNSSKERRAAYYGMMLSSLPFAKEMHLFGLAEHFLREFQRVTREVHQVARRQQAHELRWLAGLSILSSLVAIGAFVTVVLEAFAGRLSLGDVALYTSAVASVQGALLGMIGTISSLAEGAFYQAHLADLLALPQPLPLADPQRPVPALTTDIELRNVSFRYSDRHPWVLRHVNLIIPARQCVALVGLNGAGKTTIVKLLTRLYDPTEGQILWDGIDIRELDLEQLRRRCGAVFQDFLRYELTAHENIAFGAITDLVDCNRVRRSAEAVGVHDTLARLPAGYQTMLSRQLADEGHGADLSGGEWQKIALARMHMREADLLILDEPTAALDPIAEQKLYAHLTELSTERTSLLISHRFSTVRMADLIAVLDRGQVAEFGTHEELIAAGGQYEAMYRAQAQPYAQDDSCETVGSAARSRAGEHSPGVDR